MAPDADIPYGTLDLMVLKTLDVMSPLNGYAIARRIEQIAQGSLALNQGTIYPALLRLEQKGWIRSEWGTSDNNRIGCAVSGVPASADRHFSYPGPRGQLA